MRLLHGLLWLLLFASWCISEQRYMSRWHDVGVLVCFAKLLLEPF
jgi:hypothetical protein